MSSVLYAAKHSYMEIISKCEALPTNHCCGDLSMGSAPVTASVAFLAETIGTGILSFVIFALTNSKNTVMKSGFVPPIIGLTVGSLIAVLAPLTQAGFNPARDFGPRIVAFLAGWKTVAFQGWWIYVLAPLLGATVGAYVADKVLYAED